MRYLIIDKKQRIERSSDSTYAVTRLTEELNALGVQFLFATTDDIQINMNDGLEIEVLGESLKSFTHIILRGHRLHKPWEYETKKIIADYIEQHNKTNPENKILLQNIKSIQKLSYYDKLWIQKFCIENKIEIIPTKYISSGDYSTSLPTPFIIKDFTGENDLRMIDGKEKIKKNVYLIENSEELKQENLINKDTSKYFVQKFITTGQDLRIFVSNGKAIGGFSRTATAGFMTVNKGEYISLNMTKENELAQLSELISSKFEADFIAIDLMKDEQGKYLLQEISFNPGFKAYETKTTGEHANIAKAIVQSFGK